MTATLLQFRDYCRTRQVEVREGGAEVVILPVIRVEREPWTEGEPRECDSNCWDRLPPAVRAMRRSLLAERP